MPSTVGVAAICAAVAAAVCSAAAAQVANGDFESGMFAPWVITNTDSGQAIFQDVVQFDIDGPGPQPTSFCARFMAGQTTPNSGFQGILLQQPAALLAGVTYELRCRWATQALISAPMSSGVFELIVDGVPIAEAVAPVLSSGQRAYGELAGEFTPAADGAYTIGVRITRNVSFGYEVFQIVDDFVLAPACEADFDHDGSIGVPDIFAFLSAWFAGNPAADFDGNGVLGVPDIFAFLAAWFAGCP